MGADVEEAAVGGVHEPDVFAGAADTAEVEIHRAGGVVVDHEPVGATGGEEALVVDAVVADYEAVRAALEVGESKHEVFEVFHLAASGVGEGFPPGFGFAVGKVGTVDSGADELHDGIVAVGMSA